MNHWSTNFERGNVEVYSTFRSLMLGMSKTTPSDNVEVKFLFQLRRNSEEDIL
jgi:hypothetical protein